MCVVYLTTRWFSTARWRPFIISLVRRSFTLGVVRSKVVLGGAFGRSRGSRYQPTEGTGMSDRLELYSSYLIVPSSLGD